MVISVSDQIHLSELLPSDEAACVRYLSDKEIYDRTLRIPFPYTANDFQIWRDLVARATAQQGLPVHFAVRVATGDLIGGCGFQGLSVGVSHRVEIGYWLAKPYWGRGIMTAVVRRLCDLAFADYGLAKVVAHVFADNTASARVLQKCGFQEEGYLRRHYLKDGTYIDARAFGLLKP